MIFLGVVVTESLKLFGGHLGSYLGSEYEHCSEEITMGIPQNLVLDTKIKFLGTVVTQF